MKIEEYHSKLWQYGLGHYIGSFDSIAKSCIRLNIKPVENDLTTIGHSKMGGKPDLPADLN